MTSGDASALVPLEQVIATAPFTIRREVRWSDCDPAGVVFTGRFSDYTLSATDLFRRHLLGSRWIDAGRTQGFITPAKALSLVFQGPLWPEDLIDITVWVGAIRTRTFDLLLQGVRANDRTPVFQARLTSICVAAADRHQAIPWPDAHRAVFVAYQDRHAVPETLSNLAS